MRLTPDLLAVVLLGYLRKRARGRAAARTQGRIGWDLRRLGLAVTTRDVRDALAALVLAGWPIATTSAKPAGEDRQFAQNLTPKKRGGAHD